MAFYAAVEVTRALEKVGFAPLSLFVGNSGATPGGPRETRPLRKEGPGATPGGPREVRPLQEGDM